MSKLKQVFLFVLVISVVSIVLINVYLQSRLRSLKRWSGTSVRHTDKWIVIGTDTLTDDVTSFLENPDWSLVVVRNNDNIKPPANIRCSQCYYLDDDAMQKLNLHTTPKIPSGHRNRKLIGHLFALKHGAKYIHDTHKIPHYSSSYILEDNAIGIRYNSTRIFNQYAHFGEPTAWQSSFPSILKTRNHSLLYYLGQWKTPSVQQQLEYVATFDKVAPPVFLGAGTIALSSTKSNILFLRDAFWALFRGYMSFTPVNQILRGLWVQRLLWEIGDTVAFTSPEASNAANGKNDVASITSFTNNEIQKVVSFIKTWKCPRSESFYQCVIRLAEDTIPFGIFSKEDIAVLKSWLIDLSTLSNNRVTRCEDYQFCESGNFRKTYRLQFRPNVYSLSVNPHITVRQHLEGIKSICPNINQSTTFSKPLQVFSNILLIVVFNFPDYYSNIRYLEIIYRSHFPNILYCGEKFENFQQFQREFDKHVSFIEVSVIKGEFGQRCLLRAMDMNYNVDGYLYIGDDVLINPWIMKNLDQKKIWLKFPVLWKLTGNSFWARQPTGNRAWTKGFRAMKARDKTMYSRFVNQWNENVKRNDSVIQQFTDIAYIPQRYADLFLNLSEHFVPYPTHVEMFIPMMVAGMDSFDNYVNLRGSYLTMTERKTFDAFFNKDHVFLHAVKTGPLLKTPRGVKFFCQTYFPVVLNQTDPLV